jgi:hypothetical protein
MKNLRTIISTLSLVLLTAIVSCSGNDNNEFASNTPSVSKDDSKVMSRLSGDELTKSLSEDSDFRVLSDMISFFENMPNKENYVKNFDKSTLEAQKDDSYFISLSGYSQEEVTNAKTKVNTHMDHILKRFPELREYNATDLNVIIENASNMYYDTLNLGSKIKCSTCGKIGRAKMIFYTATGAVTCSPGGLFGSWACGVAGFALAGYEALGCLEDCQK